MKREVSREVTIMAPKGEVWSILADLESLEKYDAAVEHSYCVTPDRHGPGAARQCDLPGGESIKERVLE